MATAFSAGFAAPANLPALRAPAPVLPPPAPSGTFVPGTKVQVGGHRVVIEKYLSEGGFAHVYLVRLPKAINGVDAAVLKRVAVPDKEALASMRTEVETMKKLRGRRHIVEYIDSHASQLKGGGYEVFLLMEYCNGGGLIDFMNTRLQNRLTEPEILKIFSDVAQGVADMHYLKPPLLHRDLKVENVLITSSSSSQRYKLCDFGSAAPPSLAATNAAEGRLIEDDVQKHTTLQYRSPEMIDVYRKQPINEKSDIWALGVLLYKLCYYKTPFEEQGQLAILNASFKFPGYPVFSDNLKRVIASMLRENPRLRPNIFQVLQEVCLLRGTDIPIEDIYGGTARSETRRNKPLPTPPNIASPPMIGAYIAPTVQDKPTIPDITPMRRGRPSKSESGNAVSKPNPSPMRSAQNDPFLALDSNMPSAPIDSIVDDVSSRFPPIDEFAILSDPTSKFAFDSTSGTRSRAPKDISQRVTEALADDAFARPSKVFETAPTALKGIQANLQPKNTSKEHTDPSRSVTAQLPTGPIDIPQRPTMVSTGTMTSPSPPSTNNPNLGSPHPVFALPSSDDESSSQPQVIETSRPAPTTSKPGHVSTMMPRFLEHRSKSHTSSLSMLRAPGSSRPSLEGQRPAKLDFEGTINRSKSASSRSRPSSVYMHSKNAFSSGQEHGSEEANTSRSSSQTNDVTYLRANLTEEPESSMKAGKISSNVEYLRAMEEEDPSRKKEKRLSSGSRHTKRASMPSISLSSTKSLLAGRFGDAFRRFETNMGGSSQRASSPASGDREKMLTPITGSEATDGRSDDGQAFEETEAISPEVRRELERRRLSQEEKRVANAAAEYRQKVSSRAVDRHKQHSGEAHSHSRAASIQSKVKTLLDQNGGESPPVSPEAILSDRYSPQPPLRQNRNPSPNPYFSDDPSHPQAAVPRTLKNSSSSFHTSSPAKTPSSSTTKPISKPRHMLLTTTNPSSNVPPSSTPISSSSTIIPTDRPSSSSSRPSAPPKPHALRTANREVVLGDLVSSTAEGAAKLASLNLNNQNPIPADGLGVLASRRSEGGAIPSANDDWEEKFSKKYPSLAGLEMVERDIDLAR